MLACPFNCMVGGQLVDQASKVASAEVSHCSCCHSGLDNQDESSPISSGDECQCSNCLCEGALVQIEQIDLDQMADFANGLPAEHLSVALVAKFNDPEIAHWLHESMRRDSAPPICILVQSFLL